MNFKKALKRYLKENNMTAYRFSQITGYPAQKLSNIIHDKQKYPSLPWFVKMAEKLKYNPGSFLNKFIKLGQSKGEK